MSLSVQEQNGLLKRLGAKFGLYDRVRHLTQDEGKPGVITGVSVRPGFLIYHVTWNSGCESGHYDGELELTDPDTFYL